MKYKEKFSLISFIIIFVTYNFIGYFFDVDELKFIAFNDNSLSISFISLLTPILLSYVIYYFTNIIKNNNAQS